MSDTEQTIVDLTRYIDARVDTVWRILSTPEGFGAWMGGEVRFDAAPGSEFIARFPQFQTVIRGEVLEMDARARRIALSWGVEAGPQAATLPVGSSRLEISLSPEGHGTRARLVHSSLPSADEARNHEAGWRFHLSRLSLQANRTDLAATLGPAVDAWFAAWNEDDGDARDALLLECCAEDVEFRDEYAEATGRDLLATHIGNTRQYMPGFSIRATGPIVVCRGEALVPWESTGPGGTSIAGTNHLVARPDGTILRVTGFVAPGPA